MFPRSLARSTRGVYYCHSGVLTVVQTAHTTLQGYYWLLNPVGSGFKALIRRMILEHTTGGAAVANTRVTIERITFTGVSSAAVIGALQRNSGDAAPVCLNVAATTGITPATVNANAAAFASWSPQVITAVGVLVTDQDVWQPLNEDSIGILLPGEGIVIRQPDGGVASDPRRLFVNTEWEEYS